MNTIYQLTTQDRQTIERGLMAAAVFMSAIPDSILPEANQLSRDKALHDVQRASALMEHLVPDWCAISETENASEPSEVWQDQEADVQN